MRVLIMGLPGAGKTTLAQALKPALESAGYTVAWFNADALRAQHNDWDFSGAGRMRQAKRMREAADGEVCDFVICDFVCPLLTMRFVFDPHFVVWVDTIQEGRFESTNQIFNPPKSWDVRVDSQDTERWLPVILERLVSARKRLVVQELTHPSNDR